jgi:SAM-dependent methyltransferase
MTHAQIEGSKPLNWSATSKDYLRYRPGYPGHFFVLLRHLGIGLARQDILDLGSGTGALAIQFARQGARVTAVDLSEGQIQAGRQVARKHGVRIKFNVAPAEETGLPDHSFDVITASMCWGYFDVQRMEVEVPRLLRSEGLLLLSTLIWFGVEDAIAGQTDKLLAKYNPKAGQAGRGGNVEIIPASLLKRFRLKSYHEFKVDLPFNRKSWRGRLRASKWIGAALSKGQIEAFDHEHKALLERIAPAKFRIRHRIRIQIFEPQKAECGPQL